MFNIYILIEKMLRVKMLSISFFFFFFFGLVVVGLVSEAFSRFEVDEDSDRSTKYKL